MNIILLSGGSGKRLWPLSNDVRSKQFIKLFKNDDEYESMVQRVYRQITTVDADAKITIATSKSQASAIKNQLGEKASICVEPCRRDTFPAIALAAAYLHDELGVAESEAVVVCPVDPYVDNTYYEAVKTLQELAEQGGANLTLMGIEPTYPVRSTVTLSRKAAKMSARLRNSRKSRMWKPLRNIWLRVRCGMQVSLHLNWDICWTKHTA